jgi:hypothetical protein
MHQHAGPEIEKENQESGNVAAIFPFAGRPGLRSLPDREGRLPPRAKPDFLRALTNPKGTK